MRDWTTDYGSYSRITESQRALEVSVRTKIPVTVLFYTAFRGPDGESFIAPVESKLSETGKFVVEQVATSSSARYAALGYQDSNGSKIYGWLARAISGNSVVGVAASNERFLRLAASGVEIPVDPQTE